MRRMVACLSLSLLPLFPASARSTHTTSQNPPQPSPAATPARLSGLVSDPSGAVIPGAAIVLQGPADSGASSRTTQADSSGRYTLDALPPGAYTLSVSSPNFAPAPATPVTLAGGEQKQLNIQLTIEVQQQRVEVNAQQGSSPGQNGDAIVLKGDDLSSLSPDNRQMQQELQEMAGGDGDGATQLFVDGFSNGKMPPKSSIREIRINQNPYSAEYDTIGTNRIEILTKPGADTWHGSYYSGGSDSGVDSRDPYSVLPQPFYSTQNEGSVSGPLSKKSSLAFSAAHYFTQNSNIVDAITLDPDGNPAPLTQAVQNPSGYTSLTPRFDAQLSPKNTFTLRYEYDRTAVSDSGAGQLLLASQSYNSVINASTVQVSDSIILSPKILDEIRFQYIRTTTAQTPLSADPTLIVEGAFTGGGNNIGLLQDHTDTYEFQDYGSLDLGKHYLRLGLRQRLSRDANRATAGFNGEYIFPTITVYQLTEQGLAAGLSPAQIRAAGGGASQFNLTAGDPSAIVMLADTALFADDTWKLRPDLTINYGLRFEGQNHVADHADFAPRFGFSYDLHKTEKKPPLLVIQGGFGIFYQRLPSADLLQVARLGPSVNAALRQTQYVLNQPDTFPSLPAQNELAAATGSTTFLLSPAYRSPYSMQGGVTVAHTFAKAGTVTLGYTASRGVHLLLSRNTNAPLPGTYNPAAPASGVYPFGAAGVNRNEYDTSGISNRNRLYVNSQLQPVKGLRVFTNYSLRYINTDTNGGFPSNQYDIGADYGRASNDSRQRLFLGAYWEAPWGINGGPFFIAESGAPFDIVVGQDLNGDSQFNDRPAFATDLSRSSVMQTRYGNFDTAPVPGQRIIPNNYGVGPGLLYLNMNLNRSFHFGPIVKPPADGPPPPAPKPGSKPQPPERRYMLNVGAYSENILNHINPAPPVGTLGSPLFGLSNALNGNFSDGSANRIVAFQAFFQF